jgi:hypothetical protein
MENRISIWWGQEACLGVKWPTGQQGTPQNLLGVCLYTWQTGLQRRVDSVCGAAGVVVILEGRFRHLNQGLIPTPSWCPCQIDGL